MLAQIGNSCDDVDLTLSRSASFHASKALVQLLLDAQRQPEDAAVEPNGIDSPQIGDRG